MLRERERERERERFHYNENSYLLGNTIINIFLSSVSCIHTMDSNESAMYVALLEESLHRFCGCFSD